MDRDKMEKAIEQVRKSAELHFKALATLYELDITLSSKLVAPATVYEQDEMYCRVNDIYKSYLHHFSDKLRKPKYWFSIRKSSHPK